MYILTKGRVRVESDEDRVSIWGDDLSKVLQILWIQDPHVDVQHPSFGYAPFPSFYIVSFASEVPAPQYPPVLLL